VTLFDEANYSYQEIDDILFHLQSLILIILNLQPTSKAKKCQK
jgi:hypothetical protein